MLAVRRSQTTLRSQTVVFSFLLFIFGLAIFLLGYVVSGQGPMLLGLAVMFISCIVVNLQYKRIYVLVFIASHFFFLMSSIYPNYFDPSLPGLYTTDLEILSHIYFSLVMAFSGVYVCCLLRPLKHENAYLHEAVADGDARFANIRGDIVSQGALFVFYATLLPALIYVILNIGIASNLGYLAFYTGVEKNFFFRIVSYLERCFDFAFIVFLGTYPAKKKLNKPLALYIAINLLSMFAGARTHFLNAAILIGTYFFIREDRSVEKYNWIKKKYKLLSVILIPVLLLMFGFFNYYRSYRNFDISKFMGSSGVIRNVLDVTASIGTSANIIGYAYEYKDNLPQKYYSLGTVINGLKATPVYTMLYGEWVGGEGNTVYTALNNRWFGHTITYLINPTYYLYGAGYGSSYVAEAYVDFGYIGIFVFASLYTVLLLILGDAKKSSILKFVILTKMFIFIATVPRHLSTRFLNALRPEEFIIPFIIVYGVSKVIEIRRRDTLTKGNRDALKYL